LSFDGECTQIGNLTLHISEHSVSKIIGLPQTGEKWFKNKRMDDKFWTPYMKRNRCQLDWKAGVPEIG
jgi:hypothetical protein